MHHSQKIGRITFSCSLPQGWVRGPAHMIEFDV
jgi:hypothetical protein